MRELLVERRPTVKETTLGVLSESGVFMCYTLEDVVREIPGQPVSAWKIHSKTAIPVGRYRLALVNSPKFGPDTLTLLDVPGFQYIRVHSGNSDEDTEGCLLVGQRIAEDPNGDGGNVLDSRAALAVLKADLVPDIKAGVEVWITIQGAL